MDSSYRGSQWLDGLTPGAESSDGSPLRGFVGLPGARRSTRKIKITVPKQDLFTGSGARGSCIIMVWVGADGVGASVVSCSPPSVLVFIWKKSGCHLTILVFIDYFNPERKFTVSSPRLRVHSIRMPHRSAI